MQPVKISHFTLFGERCSGTNHAKAWLETNTGLSFRQDFGWKHGMMPVPDLQKARDTLCVLLVRNLPDWLRSLHLKPHHLSHKMRGLPFHAFISRRVETILDHNLGISARDRRFGTLLESEQHRGKPYANLLRLRCHKYRQWLRDLAQLPNSLLVRHEDLVGNPGLVLSRVAEICKISPESPLVPVEHYKGSPEAGEFKPKRYMDICPVAMAYILEQVDWDIEDQLGYDTRADLMASQASEAEMDFERLRQALAARPDALNLLAAVEARLTSQEKHIEDLAAMLANDRKYLGKLFHAVQHPPSRWQWWPRSGK